MKITTQSVLNERTLNLNYLRERIQEWTYWEQVVAMQILKTAKMTITSNTHLHTCTPTHTHC